MRSPDPQEQPTPTDGDTRPRGARLIAAALAVMLAAAVLAVAPASPAGAGVHLANVPSDEALFLQRLNAERCSRGLAPLSSHAGLADAARHWSGVMSGQGSLFHTSNLGGETAAHLPDWQRAGENVGRGSSVDSLHSAFMSSPLHRDNILGDFNTAGVGVVHSGGRIWVTVRFAKSPSAPTASGGGAFIDVRTGAFYEAAVAWMQHNGLTTGVGGSSCFLPDASITRAQLATFVYRLAGEPHPGPRAPFPDVPTGSYYRAAVDWMYNNGLTNGVGSTGLYAPDAVVTRDQMAAFLHRVAGQPTGWTRHPFWDVSVQHYADRSVTWLYRNGITTGVGGSNQYQPWGVVTRGQLATFLHRLVQNPSAMGPSAISLAYGA